MTNSFLDYGGYGEKLGFTPTDNTPTEAILDGTKRKIKIILQEAYMKSITREMIKIYNIKNFYTAKKY